MSASTAFMTGCASTGDFASGQSAQVAVPIAANKSVSTPVAGPASSSGAQENSLWIYRADKESSFSQDSLALRGTAFGTFIGADKTVQSTTTWSKDALRDPAIRSSIAPIQLRRLVTGMPAGEIVGLLGLPAVTRQEGGSAVWIYDAYAQDSSVRIHFELKLTADKLTAYPAVPDNLINERITVQSSDSSQPKLTSTIFPGAGAR